MAFNYWLLFTGAFWNDSEFKEIIIKSIIAYVFYIGFDKNIANHCDFLDYYDLLRKSRFSEIVLNKLDKIDFADVGLSGIKSIIDEEYSSLVLSKLEIEKKK